MDFSSALSTSTVSTYCTFKPNPDDQKETTNSINSDPNSNSLDQKLNSSISSSSISCSSANNPIFSSKAKLVEDSLTEISAIDEIKYENFDQVFPLCGDSGRWQLITFLLACFGGFPAALQDFLYIFIGAQPDHWCQPPECLQYSEAFMKNASIPLELADDKYGFAKCSRFLLTDPQGLNYTCFDGLTNPQCFYNQSITESCSQYQFDYSVFQSTIVTEWNLVCGREYLGATSQAVYSMGSLTGSFIFGIVSDNYGRKKAVLGSALVSAIFGPVVAFAPNYYTFLVARYFLAIGSPGLFDITLIHILEMMGSSWRGFAGNSFGIPYALGYSLTAIFAYFFRDWRNLQLVLTAPPLMFFLITFFFIPESPRWLVSKGRAKEAEKILRSIAYTNGNTSKLPPNFSQIVDDICKEARKDKEVEEDRNCCEEVIQFFRGFAQLLKTPKMRQRTIVLNFAWCATVLVYFGVVLNAPNLSADLFVYTILSGVLEIPSYLIVPPLINWFGRRFVFFGLLFVTGISLGVSLFFEPGSTVIISLALLGMFFIGSAYALMYVYAIELFPTSIRTYGIGSAAITGKIGNAAAPYITSLMGNYNKKSPAMVFTAVSFVASLCSLLLPETKGKPLPETVQDVENTK